MSCRKVCKPYDESSFFDNSHRKKKSSSCGCTSTCRKCDKCKCKCVCKPVHRKPDRCRKEKRCERTCDSSSSDDECCNPCGNSCGNPCGNPYVSYGMMPITPQGMMPITPQYGTPGSYNPLNNFNTSNCGSCSKSKCSSCYKCESECCCKKKKCCKDPYNIKYVPCYKTRCGIITAALSATASPAQVTAVGQIITYSYTITNTGSDMIRYPIKLIDRTGKENFCAMIAPYSSQTFTSTYVVLASDITAGTIVNTAKAFVVVCEGIWVCTNEVSIITTVGVSDVSGVLLLANSGGTVTGTLTITNSASATTAAQGVLLNLSIPATLAPANVTPGVPPPGGTATVVGSALRLTTNSIPVGGNAVFTFTYPAGVVGTIYNWTGTITTTTKNLNPNPVVSASITV